jgi:hypothetical protein
MNMNHPDPLASLRRARKTGKPGKNSVEADQESETTKQQHRTSKHAAQRLPFCKDVGVCSGVVLRWSRSGIGNGYALQRGTQIVASVISRMNCVK